MISLPHVHNGQNIHKYSGKLYDYKVSVTVTDFLLSIVCVYIANFIFHKMFLMVIVHTLK